MIEELYPTASIMTENILHELERKMIEEKITFLLSALNLIVQSTNLSNKNPFETLVTYYNFSSEEQGKKIIRDLLWHPAIIANEEPKYCHQKKKFYDDELKKFNTVLREKYKVDVISMNCSEISDYDKIKLLVLTAKLSQETLLSSNIDDFLKFPYLNHPLLLLVSILGEK